MKVSPEIGAVQLASWAKFVSLSSQETDTLETISDLFIVASPSFQDAYKSLPEIFFTRELEEVMPEMR